MKHDLVVREEEKPTVGSLFSGIGGLDLGLERAGFKVKWNSEIEPYCCQVLAKHWPDVPNLGDVRTIDWSGVERVDLICGGYPCQPFSLAGARRGTDDPRHLWPEMLRAIRVLRPRYALMENVTGHLVLGFGDVLADLAACGYDASWDCIPASAVGAPHRRDRVWIVATDAVRERGRHEPISFRGRGGTSDVEPHGAPRPLADADTRGRGTVERDVLPRQPDTARRGTEMADATLDDGASESASQRQPIASREREPRGSRRGIELGGQWLPEPAVGRVAHGLPRRMVRPQLEALGNAVVPQVAQFIGEQLLNVLVAS